MEENDRRFIPNKPKSPAVSKSHKVNVSVKKEGSFSSIFNHLKLKKSFKNDIPKKEIKPSYSSPNSPKPGSSRRGFQRSLSSSSNSPKAGSSTVVGQRNVEETVTDSQTGPQNDVPTCVDAGVFIPPEHMPHNEVVPARVDTGVFIPPDFGESIQVKETLQVVDKNAEEYFMNHNRRGKCIIFNHKEFEREEWRTGTEKDVQKIIDTFESINFEVILHNDLEYTDLLPILKILSKEDYSDSDCFVMFVLTHGNHKGEISAKDIYYPIEKLYINFTGDNCLSLAGKPKLFFINACRGKKKDHGIKFFKGKTEADSSRRDVFKIPTHADFLFAYSSVDGFYSYRDTSLGTWFVQAFCETLKQYHNTKDLLKILTITARKVAVDYLTQSEKPEDSDLTQIPSFTSMLVRDLYFRTNEG